jgi:hypothetical protein
MTAVYQNPDLNELLAKIEAYSAVVPHDEQHRRDIETAIGKLVMRLNDQKASKP